jgi:hypothetical protein
MDCKRSSAGTLEVRIAAGCSIRPGERTSWVPSCDFPVALPIGSKAVNAEILRRSSFAVDDSWFYSEHA